MGHPYFTPSLESNMSTITLRNVKGSALTFQEGDDNFTNLNNDKLENINNESISDLSDVNIAGIPAQGSVNSIDDVRNPNTIELGNASASGLVYNTRIRFTGVDIAGSGLSEGVDYYIAADIGTNKYEITSTPNGGPIGIVDTGVYGDFNWTAPDITSGGITNGQTLIWDNGTQKFIAGSPSIVTNLNSLTDVNASGAAEGDALVYSGGFWINQASGGGGFPTAVVRMTGKSSLVASTTYRMGWIIDHDPDNLIDIGNSGSDSIDVLAGGTYMWQIQGKLGLSGINNWNHYIQTYGGDPWFSNFTFNSVANNVIHGGAIIRTAGGSESHEMRIQSVGTAAYGISSSSGNSIIITKLA